MEQPKHIVKHSNPVTITATRFHDFSCGHRVVGHEGKCRFLHGHNYRVHFTLAGIHFDAVPANMEQRDNRGMDEVGRVLDFSVIKSKLCEWLEANWDHKFLAWDEDPVLTNVSQWTPDTDVVGPTETEDVLRDSIVWVSFNPTAENMAGYLLDLANDELLEGTGCRLIKVVVEETRKCSATAEA